MIVRHGYTVRLGKLNRIMFFTAGVVVPAIVTVLAASRDKWALAVLAFVLGLMGFCQYYAIRYFTLAMDRRVARRRRTGEARVP